MAPIKYLEIEIAIQSLPGSHQYFGRWLLGPEAGPCVLRWSLAALTRRGLASVNPGAQCVGWAGGEVS